MAKMVRLPWEEIDAALIAGALSVEEIADRWHCAGGTIRKRRLLLERNGTFQRISARAQSKLARERALLATLDQPVSTHQAFAVRVNTVVQIVREHQQDIGRGRAVVRALLVQLAEALATREELQQQAVAESERIGPEGERTVDQRRRDKFMRAISLPEHAATADRLASALEKLTRLERQAFAIPDVPQPDPPPPGPKSDEPEVVATLRELHASLLAASDRARAVDAVPAGQPQPAPAGANGAPSVATPGPTNP